MKTFHDIWASLVRKRPALANDEAEITIKAINLRALLRQVYEKGQESVKVTSQPSYDSIFRH